jgi:chemotaxis protein methyltransferase CheR
MSRNTATDRTDSALVQGEYPYTAEDFRKIADILYGLSGIHLPDTKATLAYSRLAKRLRALGLQSFREYCALVADESEVDERQKLLAALTTNVTRFFREPHHFEHLKAKVMPALAARARSGGRVRIWSSACSSGEEPYSIALSVLESLPEAARLDVKILATDIDPNMVRKAEAATYGEEAVSAIPVELRKRWLEPVRDAAAMVWRVNAEVRDMVSCRELNLMGPWPMKGRFDAIFCRNVAIYFDEPTQERLWSRFPGSLERGGRLYIGHSERAVDPRLISDGLTTYKLKEGGA